MKSNRDEKEVGCIALIELYVLRHHFNTYNHGSSITVPKTPPLCDVKCSAVDDESERKNPEGIMNMERNNHAIISKLGNMLLRDDENITYCNKYSVTQTYDTVIVQKPR